MGIHTFPNGIRVKVNVTEVELFYNDVVVQHFSDFDTETHPPNSGSEWSNNWLLLEYIWKLF